MTNPLQGPESARGPVLELRRDVGVLTVRMRAVWNRNAINSEMKAALLEALREFESDHELRCMVLTGQDDIFCAGGDIRSILPDRSTSTTRRRMTESHEIIATIARIPKPVVAAVNGAAVGAGFSVALLGDIVVASEDAWFAGGFSRLGAVPDMGILLTLPRIVGPIIAMDLLTTGRKIDAREAHSLGLVSRILPAKGFQQSVDELAAEIALGPTVAIGLAKQLLRASAVESLGQFLEKEALAQAVAFDSVDFLEGCTAFVEKRRPRFRGR